MFKVIVLYLTERIILRQNYFQPLAHMLSVGWMTEFDNRQAFLPHLILTRFGSHSVFYLIDFTVPLSTFKKMECEADFHLHLEPQLRMCGAIPSVHTPQCGALFSTGSRLSVFECYLPFQWAKLQKF